jgi:citronellol/citronellal dehydrogenase
MKGSVLPVSVERSLADRVVVVTGSSRGIGRQIALRAAADGAHLALIAKTLTPHPRIAGSLTQTAQAVRDAGGEALPLPCDIRDAEPVTDAIDRVVKEFGRIDIVVNNAGALDLRRTPQLPVAAFDRLWAVNVRGPFALVQAAYPHLRLADNPHILTISPPINLEPAWAAAHLGHTVGKYAESLLTLGWAAEFQSIPIAANSLWPSTTVASTGMMAVLGDDVARAQGRSPQIMADAAHAILTRPATECTGNFFTDEQVLRQEGVNDFSGYRLAAHDEDLTPDFYLPTTPLPTI